MASPLSLDAGLRDNSSYLYELECIRGLAILLVFLFHAYGVTGFDPVAQPSIWISYIISGNTGVTLFFMLSGLLLSLPWLKYLLDPGRAQPHVRNYYMARVLRIVPLYYAAVLVGIALSGDWSTGGKALLFQFVGFDMFPYSVVWWTLATEVQFYIVLPLCFLAFLSGGVKRYLLLAVLAAWLILFLNIFLSPQSRAQVSPYWLSKSLFGMFPSFIVGIIAAFSYLKLRAYAPALNARRGSRVVASVLLILLWLALGAILQQVAELNYAKAGWRWHLHYTWESVLWALIVLGLLLTNPLGKGLVVNRPLAVFGKLSYSLYVNHVPILFFLVYSASEKMGRDVYLQSLWVYFVPAIALVLSLLLALLTYRLIELPFLNLKHRIPV